MPTLTSPETMPHDALIIGGSYAGLSAAMQLVRARRRVSVTMDRTFASVFFTLWFNSRVSELRIEFCSANHASARWSSTSCVVSKRDTSISRLATARPNRRLIIEMGDSDSLHEDSGNYPAWHSDFFDAGVYCFEFCHP